MSRAVIIIKERVGHQGDYAVIVPDNAAGMPRRFTVYLMPGSPFRGARVVGRELTLGLARRVAREVKP